MDRTALRENLESLQNLLISRATGGVADEAEYRTLRDTLMSDARIHDRLPSFVRTARDLSQFWAYIKKISGQYAPRREHVWAAFNPLLDSLDEQPAELPASAPQLSPQAPRSKRRAKPKVFISYSTADKAAAGAVKHAIASGGFECFLAHDTLQVSEEWRERILEELEQCEVFVALLSESFRKSAWAPQEVGFIVSRKNVPIVPLLLDETVPFGFIAHIQGRPVPRGGIELGTILEPLARKHPRLALPAMVERVANAASFRAAEAALAPLVPYFAELTDDELERLVEASIDNGQVWDASLCRTEYLPELIDVVGHRMRPDRKKALQYQIDTGSWYNDEA